MAGDTDMDWDTTCDDCAGVPLPTGGRCWTHADDGHLQAALEQLSDDGQLDAQGVIITDALLKRILAAAPRGDRDAAVLTRANFAGATFQGDASFSGATFQDDATFNRATFQGSATFDGATFQHEAGFHSATVQGRASFDRATFKGFPLFTGATFEDIAVFDGAIFQHVGWFNGATFQRGASLKGAIFQRGASFNWVTFKDVTKFDEHDMVRLHDGVPHWDVADFDGATFERAVGFEGTAFLGGASFDRATFLDDASFHRTIVHGNASFIGAAFLDDASFVGATIERTVAYDGVIFERAVGFEGAAFRGGASFVGATFQDDVSFDRATFLGDTRFDRATFHGDPEFRGATFQHADFTDAVFRRARSLGPMLARRSLVLDGALFQERVLIEVSAAAVCCRRTRFLAGVQLRVRWADVIMDDAEPAVPSILSGGRHFRELDEGRWAQAMSRLPRRPRIHSMPRLVSLRRADVAGLTVAHVDLRACRFAGAHHLDQIQIDSAEFASTPGRRRWTTRKTLAEEHHWRASHQPAGGGWHQAAEQPRTWFDGQDDETPQPAQIAELYRALRKAREDRKDEPGAADFYYGEMEMRRHDHRGPRAERFVLFLYWLFSGYGLRASRALLALGTVIVMSGVLFAFWGFAPTETPTIQPIDVTDDGEPIYGQPVLEHHTGLDELPSALLFSVQSSTALLPRSGQPLTATGEWLHVAVRLVAPALVALAVVSIRGRVKR